MADIVLITGLSGAGRSAVADVLEDLGWYVVDNLPTSLISTIVDLAAKPGSDIDRLALVAGRQHDEAAHARSASSAPTATTSRMVFLDASTPELVRRYDATRVAIRSPTTPTGWSSRSSSNVDCSNRCGPRPIS